MKNKIGKTHRKNKFSLKFFSIIVCICLIFATLIGLSVDWSKPSWIFIAGSSTMQPLMERISNIYKKAEISANAGGSSLGISGILNDKKNIGMISKSPTIDIAGLPNQPSLDNGISSNKWENNGVKTITISRDPIAIIYKANEDLILNNENISYLYLAFAGYEELDFAKLLNNNTNNKQKLIPYGRAGGARESGTADAFLSSNNMGVNGSKEYLEKLNVDSNKNVWDVLKKGEYGEFTRTTNESSLEAWEAIKAYNNVGVPITYLNGSFVKNNLNEIEKMGFKIAKYQYSDGDLLINNNQQFNDKYNWFHPLNLLIRTKNNECKQSKSFIEWIIGNTFFKKSNLYSIFQNISFEILKPEIIKTMFIDKSNIIDDIVQYSQNNPDANYNDYLNDINTNKDWSGFWKSDYELYNAQSIERDNLKEYYGAIFHNKNLNIYEKEN